MKPFAESVVKVARKAEAAAKKAEAAAKRAKKTMRKREFGYNSEAPEALSAVGEAIDYAAKARAAARRAARSVEIGNDIARMLAEKEGQRANDHGPEHHAPARNLRKGTSP